MSAVSPMARFGDVVHDLKSSWRFKVAALVWLPLLITVMIAIVDLGRRHTLSLENPDWRTQYDMENNGISFPDITVSLSPSTAAFMQGAICSQRGVLATRTTCGVNKCFRFQTSSFQATAATEGNNHITCTFLISGQKTDNTELNVTLPQGFIWQPNPPTYVQANQQAEVDLYHEHLRTLDGRTADEWWTTVTYRTSQFFNTNGTTAFAANVMFRIPVRALIQNTQYIQFDAWQLLANWGGIIFFVWFLHSIVYKFAKLFLPDDSKLFPANAAGAAAYSAI